MIYKAIQILGIVTVKAVNYKENCHQLPGSIH